MLAGFNRYAYVGDNPINRVDPNGHNWFTDALGTVGQVAWTGLDLLTGIPSMIHDVSTLIDDKASTKAKVVASLDIVLNVCMDIGLIVGVGELARGGYFGARLAERLGAGELEHIVTDGLDHEATDVGTHAASNAAGDVSGDVASHGAGDATGDRGSGAGGENRSFTAATPVATPTGERAIGQLKIGDTVTAYNPQTGTSEAEAVQHVWINHDHDLVDVRLTGAQPAMATGEASTHTAGHGLLLGDSPATAIHFIHRDAATPSHDETIHMTANHPWLTADRGWVAAGDLGVGEPVVTLGGGADTVVWVHAIAGSGTMYNLTVAHDHTYAVGRGGYVVHNTGNCLYSDARAQLASDRREGVRCAWRQEQQLVQTTGEGTADWTPAEKQELLATSRVRGYEGHHIYSANEFPGLAADPNNIEFLGPGRGPHLDAHNGDYRNPTAGDGFLYRSTLIDMFNLGM